MYLFSRCLFFITLFMVCHGKCQIAQVLAFIQNTTIMSTISISGAYSLPTDGIDTSNALSGAYIPMACNSGYVLATGQLNITCIGDAWTAFPSCISTTAANAINPVTVATNNNLPCTWDATTYNITNGYYSMISRLNSSDNISPGWIQFACIPGYVIDPTIGSLYTCNNGVWSTKPRCLITGRCSFSTLQSFISTATGLLVTNQSQLMQSPQETGVILNGSYIVLGCSNGFTNIGGSLNVTCSSNGSWSAFPNCVSNSGSGSITTTTMMSNNNGASCMIDGTTMSIANGYLSNSSLSATSSNMVTGWLQFTCVPGYAIDPTVGSLYTCSNGVWSTKPKCLITGRCSFSTLQSFISSSTGLFTTNQSQLMQLPQETGVVLNGSYIVLGCSNGFTNIGGSLNVTCSSNGSWSAFPNCVSNSGSGSITTTTMMSNNNGASCMIDGTTMSIANGYLSNSSLSATSSNMVTGWLQFTCVPGYAIDPTVGSLYTCSNGVWSTKPKCLITGRCSFSTLQSFISSSTGLFTTNQSQLMQLPQETGVVLNGSYIVLGCSNGFTNIGGSLNVTCSSNGSWSAFPNCVSNSGSGSITTTTMMSNDNGASCMIDGTTMSIANGYLSNSSLSATSSNMVTGWLQFTCVPGYAIDPTVGSLYTCSNGVWSTKPKCLITGRCSFSTLQSFISSSTGLFTTNQSQLMQLPQETGVVLNGSYIVLGCSNGFTNIGGSLNVTCSSNGSWSAFPNCVSNSGSGSITTTTMMSNNNGASCMIDGTTMSIANGYLSNSSLSATSSNMVTGWLQFTCVPGYAIDPTVGSLYTCSNGVWSTKPKCLITGRCSFSTLQSFISSSTGLFTTNQSQLMQLPQETGVVLNGSYIVLGCSNGFTNIGGSLNVTCSSNGSWSAFPNCVSNSGSGSITTTTMMSNNNGASCMIDGTTMSIANGYLSNSSLSATSSNMVTGWLQFTCVPGYAIDPTVGSLYTCSNGVWSTKPRCLTTGRCSFSELQSFITTIKTLQITGQSQLMQTPQDSSLVLSGSYIVFTCVNGYTNVGGSLNVTCSSSGSWSSFPNCVSNTQTTTTISTSSGAPCSYSGSLLSISNGYASFWNGTMSPTVTQALSGASIVYMCISPYTLVGNSVMTCTNGVWSPQAVCAAPNLGMTTTVGSSSKCADVPIVANSYVSMATSVQYNNNVYTRRVEYTCNAGFTLVSTSGQSSVSCVNGVWDQLPSCKMSSSCSVSQLQSALVNVELVSRSLNLGNGGILAGGWIQLRCANGFNLNPTSGSLNITCLSTGAWTQFPVCSR